MSNADYIPTALELAVYDVVRAALDAGGNAGLELDWGEQYDPTRAGLSALLYVDAPVALTAGAEREICVDPDTDATIERVSEQAELTASLKFVGPGAYAAAGTFRLGAKMQATIDACNATGLGLTDPGTPRRTPIQLGRGSLERVEVELLFGVVETLERATDEVLATSTLAMTDGESGAEAPVISQDY